ncbi:MULTISPECIES: GIY-YIG nuclease family protein [Halomonas]|uniref:GIY-YIG nuclease family protein n=1 Tax=Halomonas TaxID=2745 RepID=UPI001C9991F4|nr:MULTISPECIES: GIY-YIG nuclease family protein [Halomonas]MBY5969126.1 GIY-YIG nuclease family protein [Halomonas denitrificans]MBY5984754.1 GIY-YIG nuclease family protein [Halomonas sp. DP5Y7-2]
MDLKEDIRLIGDIIETAPLEIPQRPGVYAFWWLGERSVLLSANTEMILVGPGGKDVEIQFRDWWPSSLAFPCLYVGKTTNLKKRFSQHLKRGSKERLHEIPESSKKQKAVTTSCQLRYGIEHFFPDEELPLQLISKNVGFSYDVMGADQIAERFYREDLLIGTWKPWFNVDSER